MKNSHENRKTQAKWERILAFALALSMLIIPVQFPGAARAEGEGGNNSEYLYQNNFDDPSAEDENYQWADAETETWDIKYSWTEDLYNDKCSGQIVQDTDGSYYYRLNPVPTDRTANDKIPYSFSYVWLNAEAVDPDDAANTVDVADTWTDYTVEAYISRNDANGQSSGAFLLGRVQYDAVHDGYSYYSLKVHSGRIYLLKTYYDEANSKWVKNTSVMDAGGAHSGATTFTHVAMTFEGASITVTLTDSSKNKVFTKTYTDDGVTKGPVLTSGGIGMAAEDRSNSALTFNARFKDIKVTLKGETEPVFTEDFALTGEQTKETYFANCETVADGYTTLVIAETKVWNTKYTWTEVPGSTSDTGEISADSVNTDSANSTYKIHPTNRNKNFMTYLKLEAVDPSDSGNTVDISKSWTDYTVEADVNRMNTADQGVNAFLLGRVTPVYKADGTLLGYTYYALQFHKGRIYLNKYYEDNGAIKNVKLLDKGGKDDLKGNSWRHASMTFEGEKITISMTYASGDTLTYNCTDAGTNVTSGGVGMMVQADWGQKATDFKGEYDNIKVTLADGTVAFTEDFELAEGETKDTYFAAGQTVEGGYTLATESTRLDIEYSWDEELSEKNTASEITADGTYKVYAEKAHSYAYLKAVSKDPKDPSITVDPSAYWTDYTVEADIRINGVSGALLLAG